MDAGIVSQRKYCSHCGNNGYRTQSRTDQIVPLELILKEIKESKGWLVLENKINNYYKDFTAVIVKEWCRYCNKVPPSA